MKQNRLELYRRRKGMTQEELAAATGVPVETIMTIEDGDQINVPCSQIVAMSVELDAEPSTIFDAPPTNTATGPTVTINPAVITEDDLAKARAAIQTLYLLSDGFRADIQTFGEKSEQAVIADSFINHLDGIEFLISILHETLEEKRGVDQ